MMVFGLSDDRHLTIAEIRRRRHAEAWNRLEMP
jgi:hypothetical protein